MMDADSGFLPLSLTLGNTKSVSLPKGVLSRQARRNPARRGCMGTGAFDAFDFGTLNLPHTYARLTYITRPAKSRSVQIRASNSDTRSAVAASLRGERAPRLRNIEENLERLLRRHGDRRVVAA